ncbi:MAG: hypothetical protein C0491_07060 [Novosphingobium sp.]|nr:hypothetical protein [Novosphingobium sp.]
MPFVVFHVCFLAVLAGLVGADTAMAFRASHAPGLRHLERQFDFDGLPDTVGVQFSGNVGQCFPLSFWHHPAMT